MDGINVTKKEKAQSDMAEGKSNNEFAKIII